MFYQQAPRDSAKIRVSAIPALHAKNTQSGFVASRNFERPSLSTASRLSTGALTMRSSAATSVGPGEVNKYSATFWWNAFCAAWELACGRASGGIAAAAKGFRCLAC